MPFTDISLIQTSEKTERAACRFKYFTSCAHCWRDALIREINLDYYVPKPRYSKLGYNADLVNHDTRTMLHDSLKKEYGQFRNLEPLLRNSSSLERICPKFF